MDNAAKYELERIKAQLGVVIDDNRRLSRQVSELKTLCETIVTDMNIIKEGGNL